MKKVRWGIVGPGIIANRFATAIKNVDCAELVAVASTNKERGEAFAEKYGIPQVFCGYEALAQSDAVDVVYIATPHSHHKQVAELFMNAGKHVLCEKPICVNAEQARELQKCARKNSVFLMEAMWTQFLPAIKEAQAIVDSGRIGEVMGVEADFCYHMPRQKNRVYLNELAGGSVLDVGIYSLHFAALFLGFAPEKILAVADTDGQIDIHAVMLLKYKNGAIANVSTAVGLKKPETAYVYGTKGQIRLPRFYGATELYVTTAEGEEHIVKDCLGNGFEEEIIEACRCIASGKLQSDEWPMEKSIIMLEQMDEIRAQIGIRYPFAGEA